MKAMAMFSGYGPNSFMRNQIPAEGWPLATHRFMSLRIGHQGQRGEKQASDR
jgi:hypothetical protein